MFKDLDSRTQLALSLMAAEKVYLNLMNTSELRNIGVFDSNKWSLHLLNQFRFVLWRKGSDCAYVGIYMVQRPHGACSIIVENYFRGVAKDTLELDNPNAKFEDYLKLANNFPEPSVELLIQGLSDSFKEADRWTEYNYFLGVATTLLDLRD